MHAHCSCVQYQRTNPLPSANGYEHTDAIAQINPPSYGRFVFHSGSSTQLQGHPSSVHAMQQPSTAQRNSHSLTHTHTDSHAHMHHGLLASGINAKWLSLVFAKRSVHVIGVYRCIGVSVVWSLLCAVLVVIIIVPDSNFTNSGIESCIHLYIIIIRFMVPCTHLCTLAWHGMARYTIRIFACPLFCLLKSFLCWFRHCLPLYEIVYVYTANTDHR